MPLVMCPPFTSGEGSPASGQTCLSQSATQPPGQMRPVGISQRPSGSTVSFHPLWSGQRVVGMLPEKTAKPLARGGNHGSHSPGSLAC